MSVKLENDVGIFDKGGKLMLNAYWKHIAGLLIGNYFLEEKQESI